MDGRTDGAQPDPGTASTPAEFVEALKALRLWAGQPSLRRLSSLAGTTTTPDGDEVAALPPSTASHVLTGKTLPRLPKLTFVEAFVTGCLSACGESTQRVRDQVHRWQNAWRALHEPPRENGEAAHGLDVHRQLPRDIGEFTGREAELDRVLAFAGEAERDDADAVVVVAIEGMAGVGKTRFMVRAAHQLTRAGRFEEIQLWADLRGFDPNQGPADPAVVLETFLRQLGVRGSDIPIDLAERATLYRDRLDNRKALVLLDNAANEEQVLPLLPGAAGCLVMITTRHSMSGLDGVQRIPIEVFAPGESVRLLGTIAGPERVDADLAGARRVADLCGHLPIMVALAARQLRTRTAWTVRDLSERLTVLEEGSSPAMARLELSYRNLPPALRRVFRFLSRHPGTDFTPRSAAALVRRPVAETESALETLLDEHLLQQETVGRYRFHDLLRRLGHDMTEAEDTPQRQRKALYDCVTWYLHTADAAWQALEPRRRRTFDLVRYVGAAPVPTFASYADALTWCEDERANLVAAARAAADADLTDAAWQLPAVLMRFFYLRSHWTDWLDTHRVALDVARSAGNRRAEAKILNGLGVAHGDLHEFGDAIECCQQAADLYGELGDVYGQAWCLNNLGVTNVDLERPAGAVDYFLRALELFRRCADTQGEAICLNNLGDGYRRLGRPDKAIELLEQALTLQERTDQRYTLGTLGDLYRDTERHAEAVDHYQRALAAHQSVGDRRAAGRTRASLGTTLAAMGQDDLAREHLDQALATFEELGDPDGDAVRTLSVR
ncbi:tetratricopeptide (TPR) repeat protein [Herbihabitans rhizosphaerae]|uniref:Tetratricopeptide (TPR) repeat protein n=1 Tax=Herbihabitans rhizosphaerae TaxID=1872711 RepID=A0A4Q7KUZ4_9PSEU|nr:tetratricopeptide repeat protein [Herbihabitans rhizosphaerae]RZS40829.1 tetratricopeptide (TPR) repeat protein [Herbihabitans rhizosphaerae]